MRALATQIAKDARSDVYAVGAVLFFLVTGLPPFERSDPRAVLEAHVHERPVPSSLIPGLAAEVDRVVARALAKGPAERFASASAMGVEVGRARGAIAAGRASAFGNTQRLIAVKDRAPAAARLPAQPIPADGTGFAAALVSVLVAVCLATGAVALGQGQAARVSQQCAFFLAADGAPRLIVEHGDTPAMFAAPRDERTNVYVTGRFG